MPPDIAPSFSPSPRLFSGKGFSAEDAETKRSISHSIVHGREKERGKRKRIKRKKERKTIFARWSISTFSTSWRDVDGVGQTLLAKQDWASRAASSSILSTRREVQILEANILPSGDEGRIYLHDARPLNAIHLSRDRGRWRGTKRERERDRERMGMKGVSVAAGRDGGRNFISAHINFNDAEDAVATRRGLKLRIL